MAIETAAGQQLGRTCEMEKSTMGRALKRAGVFLWTYDLCTRSVLQLCRTAGAVAEGQPTGESPEEAVRLGLLHPESAEAFLQLCRAADAGQAASAEVRMRGADGKDLWYRLTLEVPEVEDGAKGAALGTAVDVTREHEMACSSAEELRKEKSLSRSIVRTVSFLEHDFILSVELDRGSFTMYMGRDNEGMLPPTHGDNYEQVVHRIIESYVDEADRAQVSSDLAVETIRKNLAKTHTFSTMYRCHNLKGEARYKKVQYAYLDQEQRMAVLTSSDVTDLMAEQARQQEILRQALAQAEQASVAKSNFLSRMSHEIRTPMNAIIGMSTLAAQCVNDPQQVSDCISKVGISARFLLSLINDILDMSRIESGKVVIKNELIPFEEFIGGINTICYEQAAKKGLDYDCVITSFTESAYMGDAMKLQQVLINIISNAVKFTPPGGKVQFMINQDRVEGGRAYMRFTVNDTGIGISEEALPRIFDAFEQGQAGITSAYGGTGLGLAICKNLVGLMGGRISVNSIEGVGSEFTVEVALGLSETTCSRSHLTEQLNFAAMNALIVDDEITICEHTQAILGEMGMHAEWVTSGVMAVETVRKKWEIGNYYDVMLVDWKMPEMDGIETARRIRTIVGPDVTIIIMTAYDWVAIEADARAAGVNLLVTKPLFKRTLVSAFSKAYNQREIERKPAAPVEYDFTGHRVLLVEDHLLNVEVAKRLLASKHMEVEVAENGLAAIEAFVKHQPHYYDAILMDIRMPIMDGLTATRSIRHTKQQDARTIPIIAMSANAFDEDVEKSRAAGMNAHLAKPIEPQDLFRTLEDFISGTQELSLSGNGFEVLR